MPTAYGAEFRQDVVDVARKGEAPLAQIAKNFGLSVTGSDARPENVPVVACRRRSPDDSFQAFG